VCHVEYRRSAVAEGIGAIAEQSLHQSADIQAPDPARTDPIRGHKEEMLMLYWALVCLVVAIIAGVLGFGGIAGTAAGFAKILFFIFIVLLVISLVMNAMKGRGPKV
tara:strand:+ start:131 stop:451 length:321 start_codon:yes stop_codon:yes gene_type:complete